MQAGWRVPLSVALVSVAVIAFQLVLMQVLSIAQWHHFAYMVISMALLGFGAAGTVLVLWRDWLKSNYRIVLPLFHIACGVAMAAAVRVSGMAGEFDVFLLFFETRQIGLLLFSYLVYSLPFFFAGLAVTLVFYCEADRVASLYFANMLGSGVGAALIIALLWLLPLQYLPAVLATLPFLAAWLTRFRTARFHAAFLIALLVPLAGLADPVLPQPSQYKAISESLQLPGAQVTHRSDSPHGRLEIVRADAQRFAPSLSLQYPEEPPVVDIMFNNGEYFGALLGRVNPDEPHVLDSTTRGLPYRVRDADNALVLNAATGTDVSQALHHGVEDIVAVEPNRHALELLSDTHPEWIDDLYRQPEVSPYGGSVRRFLASGDESFDLMILPVLGAFGGTSGVDALREQFHLTRQAFSRMWERLSDEGMISATVWPGQPARASLRLLATWRALLERKGIDSAVEHILAVRSWGTITFLLSKSRFPDAELSRARQFSEERSFDPLIMRGLRDGERQRYNRMQETEFFEHVDTLVHGDPDRFHARYPFDVRPTSDSWPFFSQFMQWRALPQLEDVYGASTLPYMALGLILAGITFLQIVVVSLVLIILPLLRLGWQSNRRRWTLLYFSGTGAGFMLFEIALIQQLVLYLGNPVYSTAMVLATLLIASAGGSYVSGFLEPEDRKVWRAGLLIAALLLACAVFLMPLLGATMGLPTAVKLPLVFVLLAIPAFFAGMMFPFGLRRLSGSDSSHIPWACGIDSCLSVVATALATLLALQGSVVMVTMIAALAYAMTAVSAIKLTSSPPNR